MLREAGFTGAASGQWGWYRAVLGGSWVGSTSWVEGVALLYLVLHGGTGSVGQGLLGTGWVWAGPAGYWVRLCCRHTIEEVGGGRHICGRPAMPHSAPHPAPHLPPPLAAMDTTEEFRLSLAHPPTLPPPPPPCTLVQMSPPWTKPRSSGCPWSASWRRWRWTARPLWPTSGRRSTRGWWTAGAPSWRGWARGSCGGGCSGRGGPPLAATSTWLMTE